jgi:hypothetical protein
VSNLSHPTTFESLAARIRGEYGEMPGLRLTFAQACRLWQLDASTCEMLLDRLLAERFLHRTTDGAYIALPSVTRGQARAQLTPHHMWRRSA